MKIRVLHFPVVFLLVLSGSFLGTEACADDARDNSLIHLAVAPPSPVFILTKSQSKQALTESRNICLQIDLQWMVLSCDPERPQRETCGEIPVSLCIIVLFRLHEYSSRGIKMI